MALTLDSRHTKDTLQALSENIIGMCYRKSRLDRYPYVLFIHRFWCYIVLRHPDHDIGGTFFWSHHEKFVVVDNKIAFLGGIDLCFG